MKNVSSTYRYPQSVLDSRNVVSVNSMSYRVSQCLIGFHVSIKSYFLPPRGLTRSGTRLLLGYVKVWVPNEPKIEPKTDMG